ncbi:MAG: hypothetical protein SPD43_00045 [Candidatus Enterosoma sp.]|nr:hypothetical protein [Candidatus Enterosoma sp.]
MKKNLLAVLLPVVAGVALSGTGFGLWVFNEAVDNKHVGASMQVEPAINFEKTALSIESLSVTNANGKSADNGKAIVFDQSDALAASDVRWTVNIKVGVTYKALLGILHSETDGAGTYDPATTDVKAYKIEELKAALKLYQVTVYSPLSRTNGDADCKIKSYLTSSDEFKTVNLLDFNTGVPTADGSFAGEGDPTKITNTFTFTFTANKDYKDIKTAKLYTDFRELVKTSTFKFTAEFANAPSTQP